MLKCPQCNLETKDRYNLKRHIKRIHGEEHVKAVEKGGCICLECGHKCHRIEDLRQQLAESHEFIFRFEEKKFTTVAGRTSISEPLTNNNPYNNLVVTKQLVSKL